MTGPIEPNRRDARSRVYLVNSQGIVVEQTPLPRAREDATDPGSLLRLRAHQWLILVVAAGFAVLGVVVNQGMPEGHWPRVASAVLGLALGMALGIHFLSRWQWKRAAVAFGLGVIAAVLAWGFVPMIDGPGLWPATLESRRIAGDLESLPPGDTAGYVRGRLTRRTLMAQYPEFQTGILQAEDAWYTRSIDTAVTHAEGMMSGDPLGASDHLRRAAQDLESLAEPRGIVEERLYLARRRAVQASLDAARRQVRALVAQDRFTAASAEADRLVARIRDEAENLGMEIELGQFQQSVAFLADLARTAGKGDPK